jgi:mannose-6-phosphate isomerase-like protein (cupin superfamily)
MTRKAYGPVGSRSLITTDDFTVWEIRVDSGDQLAMHHHHHHPYLVVHTSAGLIRVTELDGRSVEREVSTGMVDWRPVGEIHELANLGGQPYTNVLIELTTPVGPAESEPS